MRGDPWWQIKSTPLEKQVTVERVIESGGPSQAYFILLILSALIAGYGLVANSTATVIGAMIVAPLMGPILGLALGMVRADPKTFYRALFAESVGVILVVVAGMLVAMMVNPENVDYAQREITGRIRPTLYDLAIGLAAGLAGAYCTVHPRLQASIAGVAIAVALVPPLTVTGLTLAGAIYGQARWEWVLGSFMLFFANFLTIEMAAVGVFLLAGLGQVWSLIGKEGFLRQFSVKLILLLVTAAFLTHQLNQLVQERIYRTTARDVITGQLTLIPGANLDDIEVTLDSEGLEVMAVVGSRSEIAPNTVRTMQNALEDALKVDGRELPVDLVIRTVQSTYASAGGYLYEPPKAQPDPEQVRLRAYETALKEGLSGYPGVELESFRQVAAAQGAATVPLMVTVVSPYAIEPRIVQEYQERVNAELAKEQLGPVALTVHTLVIRSATAARDVEFTPPEMRTPSEIARVEVEEKLRSELRDLVERTSGARLLEAHVRDTSELVNPADPDHRAAFYSMRATVQGPQLIEPPQVESWEKQLSQALSTPEQEVVVSLEVESRIGATIRPFRDLTVVEQDERVKRLQRKLRALVGLIPGARLAGPLEVVVKQRPEGQTPGLVTVRVPVLAPRAIKPQEVYAWQQSLTRVEKAAGQNVKIQLEVESRLGGIVQPRPPSPSPSPGP